MISTALPAENGTTALIGFCGQFCAPAGLIVAAAMQQTIKNPERTRATSMMKFFMLTAYVR